MALFDFPNISYMTYLCILSTSLLVPPEIMPVQNWRITKTSHQYSELTPSTAEFNISIPAFTSLVITYDVVVNYL